MSTVNRGACRTVVFAQPEDGLWGFGWSGEDSTLAVGELRAGASGTGEPAQFSASSDGNDWHLASVTGELSIRPAGEPVRSPAFDGRHQLCSVHGRGLISGHERPIESSGVRTVAPAPGSAPGVDSLRAASAWFAAGHVLALTALRSARAPGHDRDLIAACVFEPAGPELVADPRFSTTYRGDGSPAKVGLELWFAEEEDAPRYPRRATAEAVGARLSAHADGLAMQAHALRWHSRGEEGSGTYLLIRPR